MNHHYDHRYSDVFSHRERRSDLGPPPSKGGGAAPPPMAGPRFPGSGGYKNIGGGGRMGGGGRGLSGGNRDKKDDFLNSLHLPKHEFRDLVPFKKDFYFESPSVQRMSDQEVRMYRVSREITVEGNDVPKPVRLFNEVGFPAFCLEVISKLDFTEPTPIQSQCWPMALKGRDLIGIAKTGSGKTLAYLLPALVHVSAQPKLEQGEGPIVLILAPTRQLAVQIQGEHLKFGSRSTCVYGGVPIGPQILDLKRGFEILIATPGRLIWLLEAGHTNLRRVTYLVFHEADQMFEMRSGPEIRKLISQLRPDRQTLYWSSTWSKEVESFARLFLCNAYKVTIGSANLKANHSICQVIEIMTDLEKYNRLIKLLKEVTDSSRILIFVETKKGCDQVTRQLRMDGWPAFAIHGDKDQSETDLVLAEFKSHRSPVMIATDVAARGIDVKDINCVINYDFPSSLEDYIGRTCRAGTKGTAYTFFTHLNAKFTRGLIKILREARQQIPPALSAMAQSGSSYGGSGGGF